MAKVVMVLGVCLAVACFGAFAWQQSEKRSKEEITSHHEEVATTLDSAVADGLESGALLLQYVGNGDATLLPQMQAKTADAVEKLNTAITQAGDDPGNVAETAASIAVRSDEVVALRERGQVEEAGNALLALSEEFIAFVTE
jgi:hypothetical protein